MKLLILGVFGLHNEPEQPEFMHIYFASLKKRIVSKYDTKVILLNTFKTTSSKDSLTQKLISQYELDDIIELKNIYEFGLPERSVTFFDVMPWSTLVGFRMNLLFDYAKKHNFFDADWLFHTDTDLEFIDNFSENLELYSKIPGGVIIAPTGDATDYCFKADNAAYVLEEPDRIDWYDENTVPPREQFNRANLRKIAKYNLNFDEHLANKFAFCFSQNKIRNDMVGMNRAAISNAVLNWTNSWYPDDFNVKPYTKVSTAVEDELYEKWKLYNNSGEDSKVRFMMGWDKGSTVQLKLRQGTYGLTHVALISGGCMTTHIGASWIGPAHHENFFKMQYDILKRDYSEYSHIWEEDALKYSERSTQ